jgi:hypothetical protein
MWNEIFQLLDCVNLFRNTLQFILCKNLYNTDVYFGTHIKFLTYLFKVYQWQALFV